MLVQSSLDHGFQLSRAALLILSGSGPAMKAACIEMSYQTALELVQSRASSAPMTFEAMVKQEIALDADQNTQLMHALRLRYIQHEL